MIEKNMLKRLTVACHGCHSNYTPALAASDSSLNNTGRQRKKTQLLCANLRLRWKKKKTVTWKCHFLKVSFIQEINLKIVLV